MAYKKLAVVLGNCLFPNHERLGLDDSTVIFMAEDVGLCTHFKYHKHKLVLFLSSMRSHADELSKNHRLEYWQLNAQNQNMSYEDKLDSTLSKFASIEEIITYDIEDHFFDERLRSSCASKNLKLTIVDSSSFVTTKKQFEEYLGETKKPMMQVFYKRQRKKFNWLMDGDEPLNGKWSFDKENRKSLPSDISIPAQPESSLTENDKACIELVNSLFADHPGTTANFNWSTTRQSALYQLNYFLKERFNNFGPYEDAIDKNEAFLFHSALSPYINLGLITPQEVLQYALDYFKENDTHYPSVEGFVRQIAGWREFMRGIYHNFDLTQNHFNHTRKMKPCWYKGNTGIPPLDDAIQKTISHGYSHHIERLMILGNIMLMTGLHPDEVYKWFMEMYVDSSDWVMAPNVYGMSQFAEGGIFATKPYISGSNYILKMSNYTKGPWCDILDGLYWNFIYTNKQTFENNPRMGMMVSTLNKMGASKKEYLFNKAQTWIDQVSE